MSPSLVRCIVNLRHYPQINVEKVLNAKENPIIVEESQSIDSDDDRDQSNYRNTSTPRTNDKFSFSNNRRDNFLSSNFHNKSSKTKRHPTYSPVAQRFGYHNKPDKLTKLINKKMSQGDNVELQMQIFKMTSKNYFNGQQITERLGGFALQNKNKKDAKKSYKDIDDKEMTPRMKLEMKKEKEEEERYERENPVKRMDELFINQIITKNEYYQKLVKRKAGAD